MGKYYIQTFRSTVKPLYTVPRYTVILDIPCTVFFPQIACLAVFTRKTYLDIPCTSIIYRAIFVSPERHGIERFYCITYYSHILHYYRIVYQMATKGRGSRKGFYQFIDGFIELSKLKI